MTSSKNVGKTETYITRKIDKLNNAQFMEEVKEPEHDQDMTPQIGADLFSFELTEDMEEVKVQFHTIFVSGNMPHDWQIYAAFQLVNKQTILNIPTGYGKSHVLATAAYILANRGEHVTLLYQTELIKNRDQDNFAHLLQIEKDGEPLVRFEAIWGINEYG